MAFRPFVDSASTPEPLQIEGTYTGGDAAVPIVSSEEAAAIGQIRLAMALVDEGDVHLLDPVGGSDAERVDPDEVAADELLERAEGKLIGETSTGVLSGRRSVSRIISYVREQGVDTLVLPGEVGHGVLGRRRHDRLAATAPCAVVSVNGDGQYQEFASILLPVSSGPHAGVATDIATRIADAMGAWIDVLHVLPEGASEEELDAATDRLKSVADRTTRPETVTPWVLDSDDPAGTIIEQSQYYGLTVIGAPTSGRLKRFFHTSTSTEIRREADSLVVAARTRDIE